jgi:hypothetical protein
LLRIAASATTSATRHPGRNPEYAAADGWRVAFCGQPGAGGQIDHLVSPDGEVVSPWDWPEYPDGEPNPDRQLLIEWRSGIGWKGRA